MNDINEMQLVKRAAGGDSGAFEALIAPHERKIYALTLRMCKNQADAQDCMQDALLHVYKALRNFKGDSAFSTWVYRIVMNSCIDGHRRKKLRSAGSLDALSESGWNAPDPAMKPDEHAENAALREQLSDALNTLPAEMRSAVVLRDVHGCSYEEIAGILQINEGTVKSRISRGREKLREILAGIREPI